MKEFPPQPEQTPAQPSLEDAVMPIREKALAPQNVSSIDVRGGEVEVSLAGSIMSSGGIQRLQDILCELADLPSLQRLTLNCTGVTYMSSATFNAYVTAHKILHARGQTLVIFGMRPEDEEALKITKLNMVFDIHRDRRQMEERLERRRYEASAKARAVMDRHGG